MSADSTETILQYISQRYEIADNKSHEHSSTRVQRIREMQTCKSKTYKTAKYKRLLRCKTTMQNI